MIRNALSESRIFAIALMISLIIFVIDSLTPSGYAGSFLYILPVFICLWANRRRSIYWMGVIVTILAILAAPLQPSQNPSADLFNRPIAIIGIWLVVILGVQRRKAEDEAQRYARNLMRSHDDLQQINNVMSHDLPVPLQSVMGDLTMLEESYGDRLEPGAMEHVRHAIEGGKRISDLINDVLNYSSIDNIDMKISSVNMNEVVAKAMKLLEAPIRENEAEIQVDELPSILADEAQMVLVMQNLVGNAIKFHKPGERPKVHIASMMVHNENVFSIKDNGIGLNMKDAERIFYMFQRLHTSEEYPGTGLGLAITKKIVERHGGSIWVESEEGKGSTFFFTVPREMSLA